MIFWDRSQVALWDEWHDEDEDRDHTFITTDTRVIGGELVGVMNYYENTIEIEILSWALAQVTPRRIYG